jgi:hypothetical protein
VSYEHRAYDDRHPDGSNTPVVVLVVKGTHDVSRLVALFAGGPALIEQLNVGKRIRTQLKSHNFGRAALELLAAHGGPDFTLRPPALELRDRFIAVLGEDVSEFVHPNGFGGYDVDYGRLAEIAHEFYAAATGQGDGDG